MSKITKYPREREELSQGFTKWPPREKRLSLHLYLLEACGASKYRKYIYTQTRRLLQLVATVHLAAGEAYTCGIAVGLRRCWLFPAFAIKTCQINALLDSSMDASCWAAWKSQSIWPPTSSLPHIVSSFILCVLFSFPASHNSPAFCLSAVKKSFINSVYLKLKPACSSTAIQTMMGGVQ